jgi:alkanesulfonate monooxygenase SsuD/methylene tetrahydromethanopterin reductase-like flavin-dependent oxidoreductase (luciferase family)
MLPNHAPLVVAEQFGTLESLFPGRIDLGLGRAPGSDAVTMRALRRDRHSTGEDFPELVRELRSYLGAPHARSTRVCCSRPKHGCAHHVAGIL